MLPNPQAVCECLQQQLCRSCAAKAFSCTTPQRTECMPHSVFNVPSGFVRPCTSSRGLEQEPCDQLPSVEPCMEATAGATVMPLTRPYGYTGYTHCSIPKLQRVWQRHTWNLPDRSPPHSNHLSFGTGTVLCRSPTLGYPCTRLSRSVGLQPRRCMQPAALHSLVCSLTHTRNCSCPQTPARAGDAAPGCTCPDTQSSPRTTSTRAAAT